MDKSPHGKLLDYSNDSASNACTKHTRYVHCQKKIQKVSYFLSISALRHKNLFYVCVFWWPKRRPISRANELNLKRVDDRGHDDLKMHFFSS
jgi:hypothetical protein